MSIALQCIVVSFGCHLWQIDPVIGCFINNRFLRERGMASSPKMEYQVFLCIFQKNSVGCLSLVLLNWDSQQGRPFSLPSQRNFPISFKPKVAIAKFVWKMQKKSGIMKSGLDAMPLFLLDDLLKQWTWNQTFLCLVYLNFSCPSKQLFLPKRSWNFNAELCSLYYILHLMPRWIQHTSSTGANLSKTFFD